VPDENESTDPETGAKPAQSWLPFPLTPPGVRAPLTSVQKQVLDFIYEYRAQYGVSPTLQEVGNKLEIHRVTVHAHITALLKKKYLVRFSERASRSLIPFDELAAMAAREKSRGRRRENGMGAHPATGADLQSTPSPAHDSPESRPHAAEGGRTHGDEAASEEDDRRELMFPLAGKIAAGRPIEAVYDNEMLDIAALFPKERNLFVLEVTGDSMIDEQIRSGDYVVCEQRSAARNGEIVVAVLPSEFGGQGEATLKRFFREREKNRIRLQPANRAMSPIFIEPPKQVEIRGVVCGVIRRYKSV
jgi:SOS regulatory protein LexA